MAVAKRKQNKRLALIEYQAGARQPFQVLCRDELTWPLPQVHKAARVPIPAPSMQHPGHNTLHNTSLTELGAVDVRSGWHSPFIPAL